MPAFLQTGTSSSGLIGRDASEMSVSPLQNFSKPPPVPDVPTVIFTFGFSPWNASWAACANGATVLEPSILIAPERSPPVLALALPPLSSSSPPHAVAPSARTPHAAIEMMIFFMSRTLTPLGAQSVTRLWRSCEKAVNAERSAGCLFRLGRDGGSANRDPRLRLGLRASA